MALTFLRGKVCRAHLHGLSLTGGSWERTEPLGWATTGTQEIIQVEGHGDELVQCKVLIETGQLGLDVHL
jgi:hypothetical protein